jgi:hypothetical protein
MKSNIALILIKIVLIGIFIGALFRMPFNYYQNLRLFSFIGFLILGILNTKKQSYVSLILCLPGIIIFNPLFRFYFKRDKWQEIDKGFIVILLILLGLDLIKLFIRNYRFL